jgi:threonine/homoserine/homoserine lactone efflux protein
MTLSALLLYAAVYFAAVATPGPGIAALLARVIAWGLGGVAPFILGFVVGDLIWLTVAATGLALVARTFATLFSVIKIAGAAYLIYVAWGLARTRSAAEASAPPSPLPGADAPFSARLR